MRRGLMRSSGSTHDNPDVSTVDRVHRAPLDSVAQLRGAMTRITPDSNPLHRVI